MPLCNWSVSLSLLCKHEYLISILKTNHMNVWEDNITKSIRDFPLFFLKLLFPPANELCSSLLWFPACPLHILAYINPGSPSSLHFCLVSESSTSVEGQADKMVSNCLAGDVALKFPLSFSLTLPLSLFS